MTTPEENKVLGTEIPVATSATTGASPSVPQLPLPATPAAPTVPNSGEATVSVHPRRKTGKVKRLGPPPLPMTLYEGLEGLIIRAWLGYLPVSFCFWVLFVCFGGLFSSFMLEALDTGLPLLASHLSEPDGFYEPAAGTEPFAIPTSDEGRNVLFVQEVPTTPNYKTEGSIFLIADILRLFGRVAAWLTYSIWAYVALWRSSGRQPSRVVKGIVRGVSSVYVVGLTIFIATYVIHMID